VSVSDKKKSKKASAKGGNKSLVIVLALAMIVAVGGLIVYEISGDNRKVAGGPQLAYFTDDDGKTIFTASADQTPPFDHNGKQAVLAVCFTIDGGKTHWIQHLQRLNLAGRKALEEYKKRKPEEQDPIDLTRLNNEALQVKAPGAPDQEWTQPSNYKKYIQIITPKPPAGSSGTIEPYTP